VQQWLGSALSLDGLEVTLKPVGHPFLFPKSYCWATAAAVTNACVRCFGTISHRSFQTVLQGCCIGRVSPQLDFIKRMDIVPHVFSKQ